MLIVPSVASAVRKHSDALTNNRVQRGVLVVALLATLADRPVTTTTHTFKTTEHTGKYSGTVRRILL